MHLGMWQDMQHDVSQRKDLTGLPWQVYSSYALGAWSLAARAWLAPARDLNSRGYGWR
jgi:hypothetical protein